MKRSQSIKPPEAHTVLITDVVTMWEKLYWDVERYQEIQRSYPKERQPIAFAAINVCIAAWSLEQWAKTAWMRKARNSTGKAEVSQFHDLVRDNVPEQSICADVANTSKHAAFDDRRHGGEVSLEWDEGDDEVPPTFVLRHMGSLDTAKVSAYDTFDNVRRHWWKFLVSADLASGPMKVPEFMQNRLRQIFGDRTVETISDSKRTGGN